jgi:hypothetical protein
MDEQDNPVAPESSADGEANLASFLSSKMDDSGRLTDEIPQEDDQTATEEPPPEEAKAPEPEAEPEYEVKINGEVKKVKQSDLIAGYQKGEDYTQKTAAVAEERRQAQAERQMLAQQSQVYLSNIQAMQAQIAQAVRTGNVAEPDPSLIQTDPVEYLQQQQRYNQAKEAWSKLQAEEQVILQRQQHEAEQRYSQTLMTQKEQLLAKLPEWKDQTKMQTEVAELKKFLQSEGYDAKEVDGIVDARAVTLARKAWMYDKLMSNKQAVEQKVKQAPPKAIRSGTTVDSSNGPRINQSAMQRVKSSGDVRDAAAVLRSLMG